MQLLTGVPVSRVKSPEHEDNLGGGGIQNLGEEDFLRGELRAKASTVLVGWLKLSKHL